VKAALAASGGRLQPAAQEPAKNSASAAQRLVASADLTAQAPPNDAASADIDVLMAELERESEAVRALERYADLLAPRPNGTFHVPLSVTGGK
jgi:hypothetical protein